MSIPSLATLSVVIDPLSRESGSSVSLLDAVRDAWRQWRQSERQRDVLALLDEHDLRDIGIGYDEIALVRQHAVFTPRAWTGDCVAETDSV